MLEIVRYVLEVPNVIQQCARGGGGLATCVPEVLDAVLHMLEMHSTCGVVLEALGSTQHVEVVEDMLCVLEVVEAMLHALKVVDGMLCVLYEVEVVLCVLLCAGGRGGCALSAGIAVERALFAALYAGGCGERTLCEVRFKYLQPKAD